MIQVHNFSNSYNNKKPCFGYNYETHKLITQTAFEQIPWFRQAIEKALENQRFAKKITLQPTVMELLKVLSRNPEELDKSLNKLALNKGGLEKLIAKHKKPANVIEKYINELKDGAMLPDLLKEETGFHTNSHFYFLPRGRHTSETYGLYAKTNNALVYFLRHLANAQNPDKFGSVPRETGMALHFLQDMTVPMHTKRQCFLSKVADFFMHIDFEKGNTRGILSRQDELVKNYVPDYKRLKEALPNNYSPQDLFMSNVRFSSQPQLQIKKSNKKDWAQIQQEIFNRAVDSTVLALESLLKLN